MQKITLLKLKSITEFPKPLIARIEVTIAMAFNKLVISILYYNVRSHSKAKWLEETAIIYLMIYVR